MSLTPQSNTDLASLAEELKGHSTFALCGHINPDGDCIGSQLALCHALRLLGKEVTCLLAQKGGIDKGLSFLPGISAMVPASDYGSTPEVFIACDVPSVERMGDDVAAVRERCGLTVTIDHHAHPERVSDLSYVDPAAPATTTIIWDLIKELGVDPTDDVACCAYTGLVTDTGCFQFQNTDTAAFAAAFEMVSAGAKPDEVARNVFQNRTLASLKLEETVLSRMQLGLGGAYALSYLTRADFEKANAVKADSEPLVNVLRSIEGVQVACLLREEPEHIRGSMRAKNDVDVSALARSMNGGGHRAAAGFTLYEDLPTALAHVAQTLENALIASGKANEGAAGSEAGCGEGALS